MESSTFIKAQAIVLASEQLRKSGHYQEAARLSQKFLDEVQYESKRIESKTKEKETKRTF